MERNVCNKLSHFCRRPSKYQTWLMAASRPRSRRPTATTRKAKISCAAREQKKKAQINHDSWPKATETPKIKAKLWKTQKRKGNSRTKNQMRGWKSCRGDDTKCSWFVRIRKDKKRTWQIMRNIFENTKNVCAHLNKQWSSGEGGGLDCRHVGHVYQPNAPCAKHFYHAAFCSSRQSKIPSSS